MAEFHVRIFEIGVKFSIKRREKNKIELNTTKERLVFERQMLGLG